MPKRNLWTTSYRLGAAFFGFYLALELVNFFAHFFARLHGFWVPLNAFLVLLAAQSQNLLVSSLVATGFWLCHRWTRIRRTYGIFVCGLLLYLVLDDVYYTIFFDHFRLSAFAGGGNTAAFKDSLLFELGGGFYFALALAAVTAVYTMRLVWPDPDDAWPWRRSPRFYQRCVAALAVTGCLSAYAYAQFPLNHINEEPLFTLAASAFATPPATPTARAAGTVDLDTPRHAEPELPQGLTPAWRQSPAALVSGPDRPNIVLIVLESVGAKQILRSGAFDSTLTPNLAKQSGHMVIFPNLYDFFPATVRSHVPLATGGRSITWGSTFSELLFPYQGPTLVGEFAAAGYATALYSAADMGWENVGTFYRNLPFAARFLPDDQDKAWTGRYRVNSWGVDEREVFAKALQWIDSVSKPDHLEHADHPDHPEHPGQARKPFFLELMSSSTHHPYSTPAGFKSPLPAGEDRWPRYRRAVNFVDQAIGQVLDGLDQRHLRDNTVVIVMGDHGEAFGEWHATNFTHQNFVYDENIRNFLAVIGPKFNRGPAVSPLLGMIGDVAPTIAALAGLPPADFAGQNLLSPSYREKIVYFHKNAEPELWGLRDGRWKFIVRKIANEDPELYDLSRDPNEQHNLASDHPEMVREYEELVPEWYLRTNAEFTSRLIGFEHRGEESFTSRDMQTMGPKLLVFGAKDAHGTFHELPLVNPAEDLIAWTYAVPFRQAKVVTYEWTSPLNQVRSFDFTYEGDWSTIMVTHGAAEPMIEGTWQLRLIVDGKEAARGHFTVSSVAQVTKPRHFKR